MINSFGDKTTEDIFHGRESSHTKRLPKALLDATTIKLDILNAAYALKDLKSPPGNRLEILRGGYRGFYSIRVNQQWRLVFRFEGTTAFEVKLVDYH
jgi:proteic killer suppression protein